MNPRLFIAALALVGLSACAPAPPRDAAAVESVGLLAAQTRQREALERLAHWAEAGGPLAPVAARELGLALAQRPAEATQARRWLTLAAEAGDAEASYTLGEARRSGGLGWQPDPTAARPWFVRAMQSGHAGATLALALGARNGDGEPRDARRSVALLQLAAQRGSARAMYLLSQAYDQGIGTAPDAALARHWLEQAAEQHLPAAMQDWALALEDGRLGVQPDAKAAQEQWREAAEERRNRWTMP